VTAALQAELASAGPRLRDRVLAEMYRNPFWEERFGERGRRHAGRDGEYHTQYVIEALAANDPQIFVRYAVWLREVLVTRGMCSRHLVENFDRLAAAIAEETWPDRERAVAILHAGSRALVHTTGDAGALDAARARIAREATAAIYAAHPGWAARWGEAGRARCADDLEYHLCYLADALALARPELFAQYVTFMAAFLGRRAIPAEHLDESLAVLGQALAALPVSADAAATLEAGRAAIATRAP